MFKAILITRDDSRYQAQLSDIADSALPPGDVTVDVQYSAINYKDALAITGRSPIVREFPMVPGADFVGIVEESAAPAVKKGDAVVLIGWGVGESHWGGLAERARVKSSWLVPLPSGMARTPPWLGNGRADGNAPHHGAGTWQCFA